MTNDLTRYDLVLHEAQYGVLSPSWQWDHEPGRQHRGSLLLWVILRGAGALQSGEHEFELRRGECFLLQFTDRQRGRHNPADPLHVPWFIFDYVDVNGTPQKPPRRLPQRFTVRDPDFLDELAQRCIEAKELEGPDGFGARHWLRSMLLEIERQTDRPARSGLEQDQAERIEAMCGVIRRHPAGRWRVADLAGRMHCSVDHFIRLFRRLKGITPAEFVIQCRLDAAREHLLFTKLSIAEIADSLGYRDQFFFSRQFKQRVGVSPSGYRRSH